MKIGPLDSKVTATPVGTERKPAKTPSSPQAAPLASGSSTSSTEVQISDAAAQLAHGNEAGFDAAKVQAMAQAIRDGKFQANPDKIADKLIANAQDVLKRYSNN
jgi:negative regulator of flagellin synthesis FlgM